MLLLCLRQADRLRTRLVDGTCSLGVINRHCHVSEPCLLHPSKQTSVISRETSGLRPLWVKSRHCGAATRCPLYPQKRTLIARVVMSALCHKRTSTELLDHLIGAGQ